MGTGTRASIEGVEVLVAGAGPAGSATALKLASAGLRVLLVEASDFSRRRVGEHLPPEAKPVLEALGVWGEPLEGCSKVCRGIDLRWARDAVERHDYFFHLHATGRQLDRAGFDRMLAVAARDAGAQWLARTLVRRVERARGGEWTVALQRGADRGVARCQFIVDATGRRSRIGRALGVRRLQLDREIGLAVWATPDARRSQSSDHSGFLQIEAVEDGWWYFGTLPNDEVVAVLMTDADLVRTERTARPPWSPWWMSRAARVPRLWSLLAATSGPIGYAARPAGSSCLAESAGDGWLAVGDACIAFDPLSSRGIVQALELGMRAADTIVAVLAGDFTALVRFAPSARLAFTSYSRQRTEVYSGVQRWKERPFWSRRLNAADGRPASDETR